MVKKEDTSHFSYKVSCLRIKFNSTWSLPGVKIRCLKLQVCHYLFIKIEEKVQTHCEKRSTHLFLPP